MRYLLIFLLLLSGCASNDIVVEKHKYIPIDEQLLKSCEGTKLIDKVEWSKLTVNEKFTKLKEHTANIQTQSLICNEQIKQIKILDQRRAKEFK